ncbi:RING-H2 finger protein ATL18-like [Trifolium pratense]|uniref:RING-H2 finger protein ATL18-like n=1 Tax=Trifolium pratense TaxID=57577 RepID=A0A2K3NP00_TRIPR|nr:RING-H2 finger protein ATL18-like [Trifolium pratense]
MEIPSLPVARFKDLGEDEDGDEICSICLVEFEGEDAVSKLRRCEHVFHYNCMEQWKLASITLIMYSCISS